MVVCTQSKLEPLAVRHGHVINEKRTLQIAITLKATQRLQIKHCDSRGVYVASLVAILLRIVPNEECVCVTFREPLHGIVFVDKTGVNMKNLILIGDTMHCSRQSGTAAVGRMQKLQRIGRILNEVIAVCHAHRTQSVKTNGTVVRSIFIRSQFTISLRRGGKA